MTTRYAHTQRSRLMLSLLGVGTIGALAAAIAPSRDALPLGTRLALIAVVAVLAASAVAFSRLTIEVAEGELRWHFGLGFARRRLALGDIASAEPTRTGLLDGWGIHFTRRGWLFNVAGRDAVLFTRTDGKRFLLGTDEPRVLVDAVRQARAESAGARGALRRG